MQNYTKFQKILSFILITSILSSFTFHIQFFGFIGTLFAAEEKHYNLVSIFVQEDIYSDIKNEITTYAKNVQNTLEDTKAIIIPTSSSEHPFNIASVNEKLYFEGEQGVFTTKGNSKLIGTVFVGDFALPVVQNSDSYEKTVFPYVDFENKMYIYNHDQKRYNLNNDLVDSPQAEIWHGFISPNTKNKQEDIKLIKDFFKKDNDFYLGEGNFKNMEGNMNGQPDEDLIQAYQPYVFYYDQIRESKAVQYVNYKAYQGFLENVEDISYNRYSQELTEKLKENYFGSQKEFIGDLKSIFGENPDLVNAFQGPTTQDIPDVQNRHTIQNSIKKFIQVFNEGSLGEFRKDVYNAGRYNSGSSNVQVDIIPYIISNIDGLSHAVLKNVNNDLESYIDNLVKKGLSRDIAVPTTFIFGDNTYTNFLYGKQGKDINEAKECTIYRGTNAHSGQLIQANRGFNINNVDDDVGLCNQGQTTGYWGGNSPVNLDPNMGSGDIWRLKPSNTKNAIHPIYDILGGLRSQDNTKTPDPRNCYDNNLLLSDVTDITGYNTFSMPINGKGANGWNCNTTHSVLAFPHNFDYVYKNFPLNPGSCENHYLNLDARQVKSYSNLDCATLTSADGSTTTTQPTTDKTYNFHKIHSWIEHKSPTTDDLYKQTQYMISPNLPIDKDRYIDFIAADNTYGKINYPYLFRVILDENEDFNFDNAKKSLKKYLDQKSSEINSLINAKNPSKLGGADSAIFNILKTGSYPTPNIDLYSILESKPSQEVEILGNKKTLTYIDSLIFSIYWNNLPSVGAKYKFVMENYLSDQFGGNDFEFFLPKNKKMYEVSYLGAPGDGKNMYVKLDPEEKAENPYNDIISQNLQLNNFLFGNKGSNSNKDNGQFKCAPPEGVPIWQWIPAVTCRLKSLLPPKISLTDQSCGIALNSNSSEKGGFIDESDLNNNGIADIFEKELSAGSLKLYSDSNKHYYNTLGKLKVQVLNSSGGVIQFDNLSKVQFDIEKVEIQKDETKPFSEANKKVIYDNKNIEKSDLNNEDALKEVQKIVSFKPVEVPIQNGEAEYSFAAKSTDANITFTAKIVHKDQKGNIVIEKNAKYEIQIRGELFYGSNYKLSPYLDTFDLEGGNNSLVASNSQNIFLVHDNNFNTLKSNLSSLNSISGAKEKIFISLINADKYGNSLPIAFPIDVKIKNAQEEVKTQKTFSSLSGPMEIGNIKDSGTYTIEIRDSVGNLIKKEIEILPDVAVKIEPNLSTQIAEKGGVITTNVFTIYDQYGNPTVGDAYDVEVVISGESLTFEDGNTKQTYKVLEGYKPFRLKTTSVGGKSDISFRLKKAENRIDEKNISLFVLDKIDFDITFDTSDIKVGNNIYTYNVKVLNTPFEGVKFNSRMYFISKDLYFRSLQEYIDIKNNTGTGSFETLLKAGEKVKIEFKVEGVKDSVFKEIDIYPDTPLRIDVGVSKSKLEADKTSASQVYVEMKDQYNNIIWNDNTTELTLEIDEKYHRILTSAQKQTTVKKGKGIFLINATNIPGTGYFKVSTLPSLYNNKIEFQGQRPFDKTKLDTFSYLRNEGLLTPVGKLFFEEYDLKQYRFKYYNKEILQKSEDFQNLNPLQRTQILNLFDEHDKIIISGVGENIGKIETFYFWNKQKIDGRKYNGLYTTLLGSNYGDITLKDNLANSLIFDPENKSLAVTSLLNNLERKIEVVNIKPNGNISLNRISGDLSQDITSSVVINENKKLEVSMVNNTFSNLVGRFILNHKTEKVKKCENSDIVNCLKNDENILGVSLRDSNYTITQNEIDGLNVVDKNNEVVLEVSKNGEVSKNIFTDFSLAMNYDVGFIIDIKYNGKVIGNLGQKFQSNAKITLIRESNQIPNILKSQSQGGMVVYLEGKDYYLDEKYIGSSTKEQVGYTIIYNDPFASSNSNLNGFSNNFTQPYEGFHSEGGLGWKDDNKTFLSFASGDSVGDATKKYMSFSLINIGDPVIALKKKPLDLPSTSQKRKFDRSIGYLISNDTSNIGYNIFDYNKDNITDIVILKSNGKVELLEGTGDIKNFMKRGSLVYLADIGEKSTIETGDFTGDGYEDFILLNKNRNPVLIDNSKKDFTRIDLDLKLNGIISQIITYDMDGDGKTDLVTLDDAGDIVIHYGTEKKGVFTKNKVDSGLGVNLIKEPRKDLGALYFSGLYQIPEDKTQINISESDALLKKEKSDSADNTDFNEGALDKIIFTQMNYGGVIVTKNDALDTVANLPKLDTLKTGGLEVDHNAITQFILTESNELNPGKTQYDNIINNKISTFIKSEYAEYAGLAVEKMYTDDNGTPLKGGDRIRLDIKITNNTTKKIDNIAYVDKIPNPFQLSDTPEYSLSVGTGNINQENILLQGSPSDEYTFLLDSYKTSTGIQSLSLQPGESIFFGLYLDTNAFKYGHIEAGAFNSQTGHGDIIFKTKNENCGKPFTLYKSIATRDLEKELKAGVCKDELPESFKEGGIDEDKNGVPDYIDTLISGDSSGTGAQDYAKEKLDEFHIDTDKDGVLDREDISPDMHSNENFMINLGSINESTEKILAGIDTLLDGLTCGFGGPGCIAAPMNRAPLAPGQDPALLGLPIGDGLNIGEGLPVFSAINWKKVGKYCLPLPWPPAYNLPGCAGKGAGGRIGPKGGSMSPTNFVRLFVTPTLTGAVGIAVCLGAPAVVAGQSNPKGLHPFVPGGNCIVASIPVGCKNDGGAPGNIENKGLGDILNGNCGPENTPPQAYLGSTTKDYIEYKKTGVKTQKLKTELGDYLSYVKNLGSLPVARRGGRWDMPNQPLVNVGGSGDFSLDVDFAALKKGNFEDIVKIQMPRISPFPDFIMEWVTRQIEEIANKLTDFPTLYVILPDLSGVGDSGWGDFIENLQKSYNAGAEDAQKKQDALQGQLDANQKQSENIDCEKDPKGCFVNESESLKLQAQKDIGSNKTVGGVKAAYEFMSNLPIITIQPQKVNYNLPWLDKKTIDKALADFELAKEQRTQELERAKSQWNVDKYSSIGNASDGNTSKIIANTQNLIYSIDKNIEILHDYKRLPEKIHKMLKIKEIRIHQILCNIEGISKITGGRIGDNGKRFKAWVELYILMKAILKSWQLLVDVFVDYSASCHQCKNERRDLMYYVWKMISAAMPKIPVIQFPKWPDIYLDLHNIRVQINIGIPDYEFNLRPIVIPPLPRLYLPDSPNAGITLPTLPLLPRIQLMELPNLPAFPKIELPNLPPPPKLPKLISSIEVFLNILKIITKVMCILKTSPFVPEWRAGDQIAFISERGGYLSLDFLDVSLPQFSLPFVDAIKVSSFVNLEQSVEFLVEMSRQTALPLNTFTNNIAGMLLQSGIGDLDFRGALPVTDIQVDISGGNAMPSRPNDIIIEPIKGPSGRPNDTIVDPLRGTPGSYSQDKDTKVSIGDFAKLLAIGILKSHEFIKNESQISLTNDEFKKEIITQLPNIHNEKIVGVWNQALNYSFTPEDEFIRELLKNNQEKFQEAQSILQEVKDKNSQMMLEVDNLLETPLLEVPGKLMSAKIDTSLYNERLSKYNQKSFDAMKNLLSGKQDSLINEIKTESKQVLKEVQGGLENFSTKIYESQPFVDEVSYNTNSHDVSEIQSKVREEKSSSQTPLLTLNKSSQELLANTSGQPSGGNNLADLECENTKMGPYSYIYKGIYIIEEYLGRKISYLLFDYIDGLSGQEVFKENDFDTDGDKDIIYMVGNEIYIKENLIQEKTKSFYTGTPLTLEKDQNEFYNNNFIESVNGLRESISDNGYINIRFLDAQNQKVGNYKFEFFDIVDKFSDVNNGWLSSYIPTEVKKHIIDAFRDIDERTTHTELPSNENYKIRKNLAYINTVGQLGGVKLKTKEIIHLKNDLAANKEVSISRDTKIYTAGENVRLTYYYYKDRKNELKLKDITIPAFSNISFKEDIILVGLSSDAYIEGKYFVEVSANAIIPYVKKPLMPGSKITYTPYEGSSGTLPYISIKYFDNSITDLDFQEVKYYELYDLGSRSSSYLIRTSMQNDFYYLRAYNFEKNLLGTTTEQRLLSPQKEADNRSPEILNFSGIKVPVYQKRIIDMTDYIFEDSGPKNIKDIFVDFELDVDKDNNGNPHDDKDFALGQTSGEFSIHIEGTKIFFHVGPYESLYDKKIRVSVVDSNNNIGFKDVSFLVYAPIPQIEDIIGGTKITGKISEPLINEPTTIYRIRGGTIDKLTDKENNFFAPTKEKGFFDFEVKNNETQKGISISLSGTKLFGINEDTGKIEISDIDKIKNQIKIDVLASNQNNNDIAYPKIVVSQNNTPIYYQYLSTPNSGEVEIVDSFSDRKNIGVYYKHISSNYSYFALPVGIQNNAGDVFIYKSDDTNHQAIIKIFKDGRVSVLDGYKLEYSEFNTYIVYKVKHNSGETLGEIMIIPEENFVLR